MCGICGKVHLDRVKPVDDWLLRGMTQALVHRGPDSEGFYRADGVGLGFRRLRIIDLGTGDQPIYNEDRSLAIIFNGEIYNFREQRADLTQRGHRFYTNADTEVIIHLYEEYGKDCVKYLLGMFAFAIWDQERQRLLLARDRLGKKPLHYATVPSGIVFGSEIKTVLQDPEVSRDIDFGAMRQYLSYQYVPAPRTIFKAVRKLPPAHTLIWEKGHVEIERYWELSYAHKAGFSERDYCERLLELLRDSVARRMVSDVPFGAFLSGGIDSSIIVGLMSQLSKHPVKTFSIGFQDEAFDELPYARVVARHFGTEHREFVVKPSAVEVLPKLIWHFDEPFADPAAVPAYYVAKIACEWVTVALSGEGGDELFAGYDSYVAARIAQYYQAAPSILRERLIAPMIDHLPAPLLKQARKERLKRLNQTMRLSQEERFIRWETVFEGKMLYDLCQSAMACSPSDEPEDVLHEAFRAADGEVFLDRLLYVDTTTYLPEDLLVKVDKMTMANSLEARLPFLDHRVVEFAASIPASLKLRRLTTKHILKKATEGLLPSGIAKRRKHGFGVPVSLWIRAELKDISERILLGKRALSRGYFREEALRQLWLEHQLGRADHGKRIWALLVLELWHRVYVDPNIPKEPTDLVDLL